ncbi:MAG: hypothetical protein E6I93_16870 [Chloroflexi bacterium]|nr:MAG: hypothetical protein E6I93_16870 [Chloroflexota bacterium]
MNDCQDDSQGDREDRPYNTRGPLPQPQGDREGRPYNTRGRVTRATGYCTGDPRGRPGNHSQTLHV